ncbi:MAG: L,D-transpeptidase family protein [Sporichthyaceae bacterium]
MNAAPARCRRRVDTVLAVAAMAVIGSAVLGLTLPSGGNRAGAAPTLAALAKSPTNSELAGPPQPAAPAWAGALPADTSQVLRTTSSTQWCEKVYCSRTEAWEKVDGTWRIAAGPGEYGQAVFRSQIGAKGFAAPGMRRADDLKTPTGAYAIYTTFSTTAERPTELPWRRRLPTSVVSSEPGSKYNTWIEMPKDVDGDRRMMSWGLWLDYNNPRLEIGVGPAPVAGVGSGIFMHTSNAGKEWVATLACVQIGQPAQMEWVVRWLRPDANARVLNNL